jgi:hypothetical protein
MEVAVVLALVSTYAEATPQMDVQEVDYHHHHHLLQDEIADKFSLSAKCDQQLRKWCKSHYDVAVESSCKIACDPSMDYLMFEQTGCGKEHIQHFCIESKYSTDLDEGSKKESHEQCFTELQKFCTVPKGLHCNLQCDSTKFAAYKAMGCGMDVVKELCAKTDYR